MFDTFQSQRGSRSKHAEQEVSSSWAGAEDLKKVEEELDASMDPGSGSSRWKPSSSSSSSQAQGQYEEAGQKAAALAQMSQTGSWRRGMTAQVGITPPRSKGTSAALIYYLTLFVNPSDNFFAAFQPQCSLF